MTAAVFAAWIALAARVGGPRVTLGAASAPGSARPPRTALLAATAALAASFAAFAWWAAFDPAIVWNGASGEAAAARELGRTLPALVLVACWLGAVTSLVAPLVDLLLRARADRQQQPPATTGGRGGT